MNRATHASAEVPAKPRPGVSVIVPVYRSEKILPDLVRQLEQALPQCNAGYELILVNDCSPDGSWDVIRRLTGEHAWVTGINLMRNYGQHNALLCGIRAAQYSLIVTMDDDLQHPPAEISKLLQALDGGLDVVYGTPQQEQHGVLRDLASVSTKLALQNVMGAAVARQVSAFRAFRAEVAEAFRHYDGAFVSIDVLLTWGTNRFGAVKVRHDVRKEGTSGYTFRKLVRHTMNMMTGFSTRPLQLASFVGFAFTLFGLAILAYVIVKYFAHGSPVPGFPFLASIIALFSGAQLFALGIIGEYLARVHFRAMQQPPYVIRSMAGRANS